jgi:hypothetical protein
MSSRYPSGGHADCSKTKKQFLDHREELVTGAEDAGNLEIQRLTQVTSSGNAEANFVVLALG